MCQTKHGKIKLDVLTQLTKLNIFLKLKHKKEPVH